MLAASALLSDEVVLPVYGWTRWRWSTILHDSNLDLFRVKWRKQVRLATGLFLSLLQIAPKLIGLLWIPAALRHGGRAAPIAQHHALIV